MESPLLKKEKLIYNITIGAQKAAYPPIILLKGGTMDYSAIPIIKLELDQMKHSMLTHLGLVGGELSKAVSEQLDNVIANFDFSHTVSVAANRAISETIENYFHYGEGRQLIKATIEEAFNKIFSNNTIVK